MTAGFRSSSEITIALDNGPGGSPVQIESLVMTMGGQKVEVKTTPATAFGQAWEVHKRTGIRSMPDIPIEGFMNTTALHALMVASLESDPNEDTQTLTIAYGDSAEFECEGIMADYELTGASGGGLTGFKATLRPTGEGGFS